MDWIVIEEVEDCRVYYLSHFMKSRSDRVTYRAHQPAEVIHICPSYAKGVTFYQPELALLSTDIKTQLVTLLSSKSLSIDHKWDLLQLAVYHQFIDLKRSHQTLIFGLVAQNAAVSAHLLHASLCNRACDDASKLDSKLEQTECGRDEARFVSVMKTDGAEEEYLCALTECALTDLDAVHVDLSLMQRGSDVLRNSVAETICVMMRAGVELCLIERYIDVVNQPNFAGYEARLGLYLNTRIMNEVAEVSTFTFANVSALLECEHFAQLSVARQIFLFSTMYSLRALQWPDVVEHCVALSYTLRSVNAAEFAALQAFFGLSSVGCSVDAYALSE
ncbi:MAG: hypothetical protein P8077_06020 [Gammaproteobacteria bacterium]